jgi:carbon monoxide dehydrogenase subunit G
VEVIEAGKYTASIGAKVGPIKVGFNVQVDTKEERPPEYGAFSIRGADKDGSSKISADCTLALKDIEGRQTEVTYTSKVQIIGKLGKFAGGVMQKFADGINDQFVAALIKRVIELEGVVVERAPVPSGFADRLQAIFRKLLEAIRRHL